MLFFVIVISIVNEWIHLWGYDSIEFVTLFIKTGTLRVVFFIERMIIAENLADFLLLELLSSAVFGCITIWDVRVWEVHVVDKFSDTFAVRIIQNFRDNTLQKCFILKLNVFLILDATSFFIFMTFRGNVGVCSFGFGCGAYETVEIGWRCIKFEGRMIFLKQLTHALQSNINKLI